MEFEKLTELIHEDDTAIVAIALIISELDDKAIKIYKEVKLARLLIEQDKDNEQLKSYLHETYWKLTRTLNHYRRMINTYGYKDLSIISELNIMNDWN